MGAIGSTKRPSESTEKKVDDIIVKNKVVIFSKSYCPYCRMAKDVLRSIGAEYLAIELDYQRDGSKMQAYLYKLTGAKTVPRVFINGKCIGGGTETVNLHEQGKLIPMLQEAGAM